MKQRPLHRERPRLFALEARFMFDGAAVDTAIAATEAAENTFNENVNANTVSETITAPPAVRLLSEGRFDAESTRREIAFVDSAIQDWEKVVSQLPSEVEIVLVESRYNGLESMVDYLKGQAGYTAIHWLAHGQPGEVTLGHLHLNTDNLNQHASEIAKIGESLVPGGDLLIYGCEVAKGEVGVTLMGQLAAMSERDIAASAEKIGQGQWTLSENTGTIEAATFALFDYDGQFALPGAHHSTDGSGQVFLGGNYIELGIRTDGKFGASPAPAGFAGRQSGLAAGVGMVGDADGFGTGTDLRIDYFLPGSPEEGFYAGYKISGTPTTGKNFASSRTDTTSGNTLGAQIVATLGGNLRVTQDISFDVNDKFFKNIVTLENIGAVSLDSVRFMRSFDPDNTVDLSGSYTTINAVERSIAAGDGIAVASATSQSGDNYYTLAGNKQAKILYYSSDARAKGSYNTSGLAPSGIYDSNIYDSAHAKGDTATADSYISIAVDVGTLAAGTSTTFTYFTSLDNRDLATILGEIAGADANNTTLEAISEDAGETAGQTVDDVFGSPIAVTAIDNTHGVWQYSADGSNWLNFSGTTGSTVNIASAARLLSTTYHVRFIPESNWSGSATITYRTWSGNCYVVGDTVDASAGGGEFSANTADASISVTAVNDGPAFSGAGQTLAYTENDDSTAIDSIVVISDVDAGNFNGGFLQAQVTSNGAAEDQLSVLNIGNGAGQIGVSGTTVSYGGTAIGTIDGVLDGINNTALKITLNSNATVAATQALAHAIAYRNSSDNPATENRTVTFTLNDGGNTGSGGAIQSTRLATITIEAVNDAPVNDTAPTFSCGQRAGGTLRQDGELIAGNGTWHDVDSGSLTYRYQWQVADDDCGANLIDIPGATNSTYTVSGDYVGKFIRLKVYASDGAAETAATSAYKEVTNQDPSDQGALANQETTESVALTYQVPEGVFTDADPEDTLYYSATLVSGAPLPGWLTFDSETRTFSGTPTGADTGTIQVRVFASDHGLNPAHLDFQINVIALPVNNNPPSSEPAQSDDTSKPVESPSETSSNGQTRDFLNDPDSSVSVKTVESAENPSQKSPTFQNEANQSPQNSNTSLRQGDVLTQASGFRVMVNPSLVHKTGLQLNNPIHDQVLNGTQTIRFLVPIDTFVHSKAEAIVHLEAKLSSGQPLPTWLKFDPSQGEFYGVAPDDYAGDLEIMIKATDNFGQEATTQFHIKIKKKPDNIVKFSGRSSLSQKLQGRQAKIILAKR